MSDRSQRRPYRVVFVPGGDTDGTRRGVIVARDEAAARLEARNVADAGGRAEIQHVGAGDRRHVLAVYPPEDVGGKIVGGGHAVS